MEQNPTGQLLNWMQNLIAEQQQVTAQLLEMAYPKRRAIIADDIPALQKLAGAEEKALARLAELEAMRIRVGNELAASAGYGEQPVGSDLIQTIADQVDIELATSLRATMAGFAHTYVQLVEANQQNSVLINDALNHIDSIIMLISGSAEGVTYSSQGEIGEIPLRRYLNKKA